MAARLSGVGIWDALLHYGDAAARADAAAELESLGYTAVWLPEVAGDVLDASRQLLAATRSITVATGILNIWMHDAADTARRHATITAAFADRFALGLGVSHGPLVARRGLGTYERPLQLMAGYLDALDSADPPVSAADRLLAALGPKMVDLAGGRCRGIHTYFVPPEHTAAARRQLGSGALIAVEQALAWTTDRGEARRLARQHMAGYLGLPNYRNNLRRLGFGDDDLSDGGSDRLADAIVVWGDEDAVRSRVQAHFDAGADHVCVQVVSDHHSLPRPEWRRLAPVLVPTST